MRSAEEWESEITGYWIDSCGVEYIRKIQADALRAAAQKCRDLKTVHMGLVAEAFSVEIEKLIPPEATPCAV